MERGCIMRKKRYGIIQDIRDNKTSYILMAPMLILILIFIVAPVCIAIALSFTYYNIIEFPKFAGFSNYQKLLLEDDVFLIALKNTMLFSFVTGPVSYGACLLMAWFVNDLKPKMRAVVTLMCYAPALSGNAYFIWTYLFSGDSYGFVNAQLLKLGLLKQPLYFFDTPGLNLWLVIFIQLWMSLGTGFLVFIAGLQGISRDQYEAASVDGISNQFQELWHITLPNMKPQLLFGAVLQVAATFAVSDICMNLTGFPSKLYSTHTIVLHMIDYGSIRYEMGYASAIAVFLFAITVLVMQGVRMLLKLGKDE